MPNGHGRSFSRAQTLEAGRHQSYEQAFEGEYAFSLDRGDKPPFETYKRRDSGIAGYLHAGWQVAARAWRPMAAEPRSR